MNLNIIETCMVIEVNWCQLLQLGMMSPTSDLERQNPFDCSRKLLHLSNVCAYILILIFHDCCPWVTFTNLQSCGCATMRKH